MPRASRIAPDPVTTVYGIKNCDTMKKAFAWLVGHGVRYAFHDYKASGIDLAHLKAWSTQVGWETLLNTRGTTWRKLSPSQQANLDEGKALKLMMENPSLIKRPVLENGKDLLVGFAPERYAAALRK
jgi:arsenate reductase